MSNYKFSRWMENLPNSVLNIPICDLVIPGSHDSFTYSIKRTSDISPDASNVVKYLTRVFGCLSKSIIYRWSVTQELKVSQQLSKGIRYFDIRLAVNRQNGIIHSCHSLYGQPVVYEFIAIKDFLQFHTQEIVLLDFNHYYNFSRMEHLQLLDSLQHIFGDLLVPFLSPVPCLLKLWEVNHRVFIFYRFECDYKNWIWPGEFIPSPWCDTDDPDCLIDFLDNNYKSRKHEVDRFYVTQGVLTPTTGTILRYLFAGNLRNTLVKKLAPKFLRWLKTTCSGVSNTNCVIIDFFNDNDFVSDIIDLNIQNPQEN